MVAPTKWGTHVWYSIHLIALGYPMTPTVENKRQYHSFYHQLAFVLPCQLCRDHYAQILQHKLPLTMEHLRSRETLFAWTVAIHNIVNVDLGKPVMPYERAVAFFERFSDNTARLKVYQKDEGPVCSEKAVDELSGTNAGLSRAMALQDALALSFLVMLLLLNIKVAMYARS